MKILDNTKSLSTLVSDTSNGLGQIQPLTCVVTEELNGIYELDFTVNVNDRHYADLKNSGLVKVTVGDGSEQIFRIYKIDEPINMISSVHCQHITYDLSKVVVKPFTATGAVNIKNQLVANMLGSYPFSTWTDITNTTSTFTNDIPRYFRECLGGYEGSVLDVLRPEYEWDNLTVKMYARRGADNGVRISYGKNLIDYSQEQNNENVYDGVYGYAVVDDETYKADSYFNKTGATYPRILNVDFSSDYESGQVPTPSDLLAKATTYAQNNSIEVPSINIKIDFIPLWQTEEYKNILPLERVSLGDTVHVFFDKLNVEASSRVIKTQWNVLTNKYDSIELGDAKANLNTIINDSVSTAVDEAVSNMDIDVGYIEEDLNNLADLITNGLGLFVTKNVLIDGSERIVLHNKPDVATSDVLYYIGANGLVVSTDGGQTWNAGFDSQGNAYFNALAANIIRALQIYGSTITFGDINNKYITASVYSDSLDNPLGVSFDGSGYVRFQPHEEFYVENRNLSDVVLNSFKMTGTTDSATPEVSIKNYSSTTGNIGNSLSMSASSSSSSFQLINRASDIDRNTLKFSATSTGTTVTLDNRDTSGVVKNILYMQISSTQTRTYLYNNRTGSDDYANRLYMIYNTSRSAIEFQNYEQATTNVANYVNMSSNSTHNQLYIANNIKGGGGNANYIILTADSTGNAISIYNNDRSGSVINRLDLSSDGILSAYSSSDFRLESGGAIRMSSSGGQDVTISSADDLNISWGDKLYINGTARRIYFNTDGSVTWGSYD